MKQTCVPSSSSFQSSLEISFIPRENGGSVGRSEVRSWMPREGKKKHFSGLCSSLWPYLMPWAIAWHLLWIGPLLHFLFANITLSQMPFLCSRASLSSIWGTPGEEHYNSFSDFIYNLSNLSFMLMSGWALMDASTTVRAGRARTLA